LEDRQFQGLEVSVVEALPDVARETIECAPVHPLHADAPRLDDDRQAGDGDLTTSGPG
jgi:hypothetical protein